MRRLVLLKGLPGSGKSTFLEKNQLHYYSISSDQIRLMLRSPEFNLKGDKKVSSRVNDKVKKTMMSLVEERMKNGDFTIIDANHIKKEDIKKYIPLAQKYRYKIEVVSFPVSLKKSLIYNIRRPKYKRLTKEKIEDMFHNIEEVPKGIKVFTPKEFLKSLRESPHPVKYDKIVHFGDIQGCFEPLNKYFKDNPISSNILYIFVGDYLDRGKENNKVLSFLFKNMDSKNFVFLEGNHEEYLWNWSVGIDFFKFDFEKTKKQIENFSKKKIKKFCNNLKDFFYYKAFGKEVLVVHAGFGFFPKSEDFFKISSSQFIKGIGQEGNTEEFFNKQNKDKNKYIIHGHKNRDKNPIRVNNSFNLENKIDNGGTLRIVELTKDGFKTIEIQN